MQESLAAPVIHQEWDAYSDEQHQVWATLYERLAALKRLSA